MSATYLFQVTVSNNPSIIEKKKIKKNCQYVSLILIYPFRLDSHHQLTYSKSHWKLIFLVAYNCVAYFLITTLCTCVFVIVFMHCKRLIIIILHVTLHKWSLHYWFAAISRSLYFQPDAESSIFFRPISALRFTVICIQTSADPCSPI